MSDEKTKSEIKPNKELTSEELDVVTGGTPAHKTDKPALSEISVTKKTDAASTPLM